MRLVSGHFIFQERPLQLGKGELAYIKSAKVYLAEVHLDYVWVNKVNVD